MQAQRVYSTGEADLLLSALTLSAGDVTSTGGIVSLSAGGKLSGIRETGC